MDKKAIDESIKFRGMLEIHLRVPVPVDYRRKTGLANVTEALYWLASHVGTLVSKVEDLQQEVKTLKKKGVKDGGSKGIRNSKV